MLTYYFKKITKKRIKIYTNTRRYTNTGEKITCFKDLDGIPVDKKIK